MDESDQTRPTTTQSWRDRFEDLHAAGEAGTLDPAELEKLAIAAYMIGRVDAYCVALEDAHRGYEERHALCPAIRCAFWLGMHHALQGDMAHASGWFSRAERLLDAYGEDCAERGYLLIPHVFHAEGTRQWRAAHDSASTAADIARRFGDADLTALAVHAQGHALLRDGRMSEGLPLLDEAMVMATVGNLNPIVTGTVYCHVIEGCKKVCDIQRAQEWTAALAGWCDDQEELVAFQGECLLYRAELLRMRGEWDAALDVARLLGRRFAESANGQLAAAAAYERGQVYRLRGDFQKAEDAYAEAIGGGHEAQPGLGLLRLIQGDSAAASAAIRRALGEATDPLDRAAYLPAQVEISLAEEHLDEANAASEELTEVAAAFGTDLLRAMAAHAQGAVLLAGGDAWSALAALRTAGKLWRQIELPYEEARSRMIVGRACRKLDDFDTAALELEAARATFEALGAKPDQSTVDALLRASGSARKYGLTARELEVLQRVAYGDSNRQVAQVLNISEHTVARHLQNIFAKLDVSSRTEATTFAHRHQLMGRDTDREPSG